MRLRLGLGAKPDLPQSPADDKRETQPHGQSANRRTAKDESNRCDQVCLRGRTSNSAEGLPPPQRGSAHRNAEDRPSGTDPCARRCSPTAGSSSAGLSRRSTPQGRTPVADATSAASCSSYSSAARARAGLPCSSLRQLGARPVRAKPRRRIFRFAGHKQPQLAPVVTVRREAQALRAAPSVHSASAGTGAQGADAARAAAGGQPTGTSTADGAVDAASSRTPRWPRSRPFPRRLPRQRQCPTRPHHHPARRPLGARGHAAPPPPPAGAAPGAGAPPAPSMPLGPPPTPPPAAPLAPPERDCPGRLHRSGPASRPPPRPVRPVLWERLRQYRFRPRAPSATQQSPPRPPEHCAANPPAAILCRWPVASVPPSTPSPTSTSASSG